MKAKKGMYWHEYHRGLISYCFDYDARIQGIRNYKPTNEIKSRIKWFRPVKGKLPDAVVKAANALTEARVACNEARATNNEEPCRGTGATWDNALEVRDDAEATFDKAIADNKAAIEKLHAKECPNCSWDGERLVF